MSNQDVVADLKPASLWQHFARISEIPRCSGNEAGVREYLLRFAAERNLEAKTDAAGNVVILVPGTEGLTGASAVALQGHMDMVCEKAPSSPHDFSKDPIQLRRDGDAVTATDTTLGADNAIGFCAALAAVDEKIPHPPLELLFTVDEETGLTGAAQLDGGLLSARTLLNLDSEEDGACYIGCAGGLDAELTTALTLESPPSPGVLVTITVGGLRGGHSGLDIIENRGNAVRLLARLLRHAQTEIPLLLAGFGGGTRRNAIARDGQAEVVIDPDHLGAFTRALEGGEAAIRDEYGAAEPELTIGRSEPRPPDKKVWSAADTTRVLRLLAGLPHGVLTMSRDIPNLVETSANLATVGLQKDKLVVGTNVRSAVAAAKRAAVDTIRSVGELAGFEVTSGGDYPGWQPNPDSAVLALCIESHLALFGEKPAVKAIHAGLECGILGEKLPGCDMISFGPRIEGAHSPTERTYGASVERFWRLLEECLKRLG